MRALGLTRFGGPEVLQVLDLPVEALGPGQVRVRVTAATVNPTDLSRRSGARSQTPRPEGGVAVPGMDIAGTVLEIGPDTDTVLSPGQHVMAIVVPSGAHGGYREEIVLPARSVVPVPAGSDDTSASTLPMNGLTALQALDALALEPGSTLAVTGGAGAFGGYAIQLAKARELTVVADAAEDDIDLLSSLGADVIVPRSADTAQRIRERFPDGVDGAADGALLNEAILPAVRDGGAVATVRGYRGDGRRGVRVSPVQVVNDAEECEKLDSLRALAERGALTLRVADVYPAAQAADAHRRLEAGGVRGRLVLRFQPWEE